MNDTEKQQYHEEYASLKKLQQTIFGLLLVTVIGGFGSMYHFNARVAVIEAKLNEGPRFTMNNFNQFHTEYEENKLRTEARLAALERLSTNAIERLARMDEKLSFLVESVKSGNK